MSEKTPAASEWWFSADMKHRKYCVGIDLKGLAVWQQVNTGIVFFGYSIEEMQTWHHEPACDSWTWEPETFPQWYGHHTGAFGWGEDIYVIRRTSQHVYEYVHAKGRVEASHTPWNEVCQNAVTSGTWLKVTREQAESLVTKPAPAESPDDWVTQDRVPDRPGIDQWKWSSGCGWYLSAIGQGCRRKHGEVMNGDIFQVRCRRKDLPPLPEPEKKPEFTSREMDLLGCVVHLRDQMVKICKQLDDCEKAIKTREVEVPL